jgi:hypothetical protein
MSPIEMRQRVFISTRGSSETSSSHSAESGEQVSTPVENSQLEDLKRYIAEQLLALPADQIYDPY